MASKKVDTNTLSLQDIIKRRNLQINRTMEASGETLRVQVDEGSTRTKGRKGGETPDHGGQEDDGSVGVLTIVADLLDKMSGYYTWSQQQAKIICWVAVSACIVGLLVIAAAVTLSALKLFTMEKEILTAVGGMITAVFGGTSLLVYRSSVKQLTYFHKSLHEDQRFLMVVDLLWRFSKETDRDKMLAAIIRNSLKINLAVALQQEPADEEVKTDKTDDEGQNNGGNSGNGDDGGGNNSNNNSNNNNANPPDKPPTK